MTVQRTHGTPRPQVARLDEMPKGVPGSAHEERPEDRARKGAFAPGNTLASLGGKARKNQTRLADRLGIATLAATSAFQPYKRAAATFRKHQACELARNVGGGICGAGPSSLVATAALQLAWSRYLSDLAAETFDPSMAIQASRLGDASRQSLLAAHELCALEAKARATRSSGSPVPWLLPAEGEKR